MLKFKEVRVYKLPVDMMPYANTHAKTAKVPGRT